MKETQALVYHSDDELIDRVIRSSGYKGELLTCSFSNPEATFYVENTEKTSDHTRVNYIYKGQPGSFLLPFIDEASIRNSVTCATVSLYLGLSAEELSSQMQRLEPVAMRLEVKEGQHGCTLINDSYNSDINSLAIALDFMSRRPDHQGRRRTLILSDIYQSGMTPDKLYAEVSALAVSRGVERFIGIGEEISSQADKIGIADKAFFPDTDALIASDLFKSIHDEVILLKVPADSISIS